MFAAMVACFVSGPAWAGSGPWILASGDHQVYVGADAQHFRNFAPSSGSYGGETLVVGNGISSLGFVGIVSMGLGGRFEAEFEVPWFTVFGHDPESEVCVLLGLDACARTQGIGVVRVQAKGQVLDELYGAPFSLSLGMALRFGQLTAEYRERVTTLGEGTFDIVPQLSIGRVGNFGSKGAYWSVNGDLGVMYRIPLDTSYPGYDHPIPGVGIVFEQSTLFTPFEMVTFGPTFSLLSQPTGLEFEELDLGQVDRFAALRILSMRAGLKMFIRDGKRLTFVLGVQRTVYAENNPADVVAFNTGISIRDLFRRREP
jgi:hypothetical protein